MTRYGNCPECGWYGAVNNDGRIRRHRQASTAMAFKQDPDKPICVGGMAEKECTHTSEPAGPRDGYKWGA